jgi:Fic-DOC domain mobile mystery protein B
LADGVGEIQHEPSGNTTVIISKRQIFVVDTCHLPSQLFGDVRYWIESRTHSPDETALRFHHRLVFIHPFSNGNGRHARLIADVLITKLGRPSFTWGSVNLVKEGEARTRYLEAIRAADDGDIQSLLKFARS